MGKNSSISWTDHSWNPWQGCRKISEGCKNCYMFRDKKRYGQDGSYIHRSSLKTVNNPLTWPKPAKIFVCSWSDFFIEEADEWRNTAYDIMKEARWHTYILLTKRPERILDNIPDYWQEWPKNVWLGITAENQDRLNERYKTLDKIPAYVRFLSLEPLLGPINILMPELIKLMNNIDFDFNTEKIWESVNTDVTCINWVIVGAESGSNARPCKIEWVRNIVEQCKAINIPVFIKQLEIDGKIIDNPADWPEDLRLQEFPE